MSGKDQGTHELCYVSDYDRRQRGFSSFCRLRLFSSPVSYTDTVDGDSIRFYVNSDSQEGSPMSNYSHYEDIKNRLEAGFNPEQAKLLAEVIIQSRNKAELTTKAPASPAELQQKLKTTNRYITIILFQEVIALVIGGVLIADSVRTRIITGYDVFLFSMWGLLVVACLVVLADLISRRKRLKRLTESTSMQS